MVSQCALIFDYSFDLPDDVFQPGETRPTRPKKKIVKKTETIAQKRSVDSLDVSAHKCRVGIWSAIRRLLHLVCTWGNS